MLLLLFYALVFSCLSYATDKAKTILNISSGFTKTTGVYIIVLYEDLDSYLPGKPAS